MLECIEYSVFKRPYSVFLKSTESSILVAYVGITEEGWYVMM